ncbi:MAG: translation initiation factor IF-2 [Bacteroidales bacterium]|jgi:translation initiation factor IF-2|nr:translation initiation factor IF-2 [Bacteroidales bacterium]
MIKGKKTARLSKAAKEFNVGISTIVEFLNKTGLEIDSNPNSKLSPEVYDILNKEYSSDISAKKESEELSLSNYHKNKESVSINDPNDDDVEEDDVQNDEEILIRDVSSHRNNSEEQSKRVEKSDKTSDKDDELKKSSDKTEKLDKTDKLKKDKFKVVGKIDLDNVNKKTSVDKKSKKSEDSSKTENQEKTQKTESSKEKSEKTESSKEKTSKPENDEKKSEKGEDEHKNVNIIGKIDLNTLNQKTRPDKKQKKQKPEKQNTGVQKNKDIKKKEEKRTSIDKKKVDKKKETTEKSKPEKIKKDIIEKEEKVEGVFKSERKKLSGPTVVGKINLPEEKKPKKKKPVASSSDKKSNNNKFKKKKRRRIHKENVVSDDKKQEKKQQPRKRFDNKTDVQKGKTRKKKRIVKPEINDDDVQKQIKDTLARLTSKGKSKGSRHRRDKRDAVSQKKQQEEQRIEEEKKTLKVTEFISVTELSSMMDVPPTKVIATCMNLGLLVSINQRLNADTIILVADEFNFEIEFISVEHQESISDNQDAEEDLLPRSPIVTVMGHVDHGKTSLLDFIRSENVIAGEAGGITQHIGAYNVKLKNNKTITFLDTPGHEAFTAMRARGAQVTDIAIIVVSADDSVMPQTEEAINHASAAGVPIIFAINKIDKDGANPEKIKEELANKNYLVEDWGGKYQSKDISAKNGTNIEELLEKVLLEAEMLDLKANPNRVANGTVIESSLDKGRGYMATILVQGGTMKLGDILLAGSQYGHIKAMFNERGKPIKIAAPATPVQVLGLNGAPQSGDTFNVMESDKDARDIANKREQLKREQELRTQKHITLDEIGRRIAIGDFHEINVVVKGDVDGSIEALTDSLLKLSTEEVQVNIIHKGVGQISESDVLLAAASDAVIVGFQVRPSIGARKLAEKEEIDIRLYSIIYDAINDLRDAMEGMLSPEIKEEIVSTIEVRDIFKVKKVGTIAGCIIKDGKINRNNKVRVIRDGIVIYTGELGSLKRFKDDVKEVKSGYECGLNIEKFNDVKDGDVVEGYIEKEVKKRL